MIRSIIFAVGILFSVTALAENIVTLNVQQALLSSSAAEDFRAELKKEFSGDEKKLRELEEQAKKLQKELQEGQGTQTQEVTDQKRVQFQKAYGEYQRLGQELQKKQREREQAFLKEVRPVLDKVIRGLIEEKGYDMVINRTSTIFVKPERDITVKVIELLNKQ